MQTTIILEGKDAKKWAMMQALDALGVFDVAYGKVSIDFDGQGKVSNVKIEKNFGVLNLSTTTIDIKL